MKHFNYIIFLVLIILFSCKEEVGPTFISGKVIDNNQNTIGNIDLRVYHHNYKTFPSYDNPFDTSIYVHKIPVDSYGNFSFKSDVLSENKIYYLVYNDNEKITPELEKIYVGKKNTVNVEIKYFNNLKIRVKQTEEICDSIKFHYDFWIVSHGANEFLYSIFDAHIYSFKTNIDTVLKMKSIPEYDFAFYITHYKNGERFSFQPLIKYIPDTDTVEVLIE